MNRVYLLNGTSSAGKTSTAKAMQNLSEQPLMLFGIDTLLAMVPPLWGGGHGGPLSAEGFRYIDSDEAWTRIGYGPRGWDMMCGYHRAVRAFAQAGNDVVVDELMLGPEVYADWKIALHGVQTTWVKVTCDLEIAEQREEVRGQRAGLARGHLDLVHSDVSYDLTIDTSIMSPEECARRVLTHGGRSTRVLG